MTSKSLASTARTIPYVDDQDNVALAPKSNTVILIHPTDFTGKFVFHCHVTFHEDHGMMATVQVVREPTVAAGAPLDRSRRRPGDQLLRLRLPRPAVGEGHAVLLQPARSHGACQR